MALMFMTIVIRKRSERLSTGFTSNRKIWLAEIFGEEGFVGCASVCEGQVRYMVDRAGLAGQHCRTEGALIGHYKGSHHQPTMPKMRCTHLSAKGMEGCEFSAAYFAILVLMTNVDASYDCLFCLCAPPIILEPVEDPTSDFFDIHHKKRQTARAQTASSSAAPAGRGCTRSLTLPGPRA